MIKLFNAKNAQAHFIIILAIIITASLFFVVAQNETNQTEANLCENIICENSEIECPNNSSASCSNSCDIETGECSSCVPDCSENIEIQPSNESELLENENETLSDSNETPQEITKTIPPGEVPIFLEIPEINIEVSHLGKITRGEILEITGTMTNKETKTAKGVKATWILPPEFQIISGKQTESCGNLKENEVCNSIINIQPSISSELGNNEIKIEVNYNE